MTYTTIEKSGEGRVWLGARKGLIGASEAPVVVNMSSYMTQRDLWQTKRSGIVSDNDIDLFYFAKELEGPIARRVARKWPAEFGGMSDSSPGLLRWDEHPHLGATPDRLVEHEDHGLVTFQIKALGPYQRKRWGELASADDVPDEYRIQVIQENAVLGKPGGWIAPLFGLHDLPHPVWIPTDVEFLEWYLEESTAWWDRHMIRGEEPPVSFDDDDLVTRWPGNAGVKVEATPELVDAVLAGKVWRDTTRKWDETADEKRKADIVAFMTEHEDATELLDPDSGELILTWRPKKSPDVFDKKALAEATPEDLAAAGLAIFNTESGEPVGGDAIVGAYSRPGKPQRSMLFKPTLAAKKRVADALAALAED